MLDEETQSEQQRKDGVHLSATEKEHCIPDHLVQYGEFRKLIEIHMLNEVEHHDAADGYAAKDVCCIHARIGQS